MDYGKLIKVLKEYSLFINYYQLSKAKSELDNFCKKDDEITP